MPVVWVIDAYRAGERNQVLALANALAWPYEIKRLSYRKYEFLTNIFRGSDLRGIRLADSDVLQAPWPDLVISSGLRNEAVCRWIKCQSGGHTRIVHVGNPWADPVRFDLVITTPQYRIPERDNVLQNVLTLSAVTDERLRSEAESWRMRVQGLAGPYTAVIVGGDSGPFTFGKKAALRLAKEVNALVNASGGSALVTTSSRTDTDAAKILQENLQIPHNFFHWAKDAQDNPYFAWLGLAQQIVVTGDSISMLSEACATAKPVYLFDLGQGRHAMRAQTGGRQGDNDWRLGGVMYTLLMKFIWQKVSRDICLVHERLIADGRASWLGDFVPLQTQQGEEMQRAVAAVKELFDQSAVGAAV